MEATPRNNFPSRLPVYTPSSCRLFTPARKQGNVNTPRTCRLQASTRRFGTHANEDVSFEGLVNKQWKLYSLSPLYNFKLTEAMFRKYARSLDTAFIKNILNWTESSSLKSNFSTYPGLRANDDDPEAVRIQVFERSNDGQAPKVVLQAILVSVEVDPISESEQHSRHFTYYPVILVTGNKARTETLLSWIEKHFDCHAGPLSFDDNNMRWMLAVWSSQYEAVKRYPVLMQYSVENICDDAEITSINCKLDSKFCKDLWDRLYGDVSQGYEVDHLLVKKYVEELENHLENIMQIFFSKLSLSEVGTSVAYVSHLGKIKILSNAKSAVYCALSLICGISRDKFMVFS